MNSEKALDKDDIIILNAEEVFDELHPHVRDQEVVGDTRNKEFEDYQPHAHTEQTGNIDTTNKKLCQYANKLRLTKMNKTLHENPLVSPQLKLKLMSMFDMIQAPFNKYKGTRVSFLTYSYVLYKFYELLGQDHLLNSIKQLKSHNRLRQHDKIWKHICAELKWQFIPTI